MSMHLMSVRNTFLATFMLMGICSAAQDPAFDDFEHSGGPGPNWTIYFGGTNVTIVYDSDLGLINGQQFGIAAWTGSTFDADQYSEAVISSEKIDSMWAQVFVRRRTSDNARYAFHWSDRDTNVGGGWFDIKYDGVPTPQTRIMASTWAPPPAAGDTLRVEVITNLITGFPVINGYHNGDLVVSAIDSLPTAILSGEPGMAFRFRLGWPATWPSKVFEEWNGGSLAGFSTGIEERAVDGRLLSIAPNPAVTGATLVFNAHKAGTAEVCVVNALGEMVIEQKAALVRGRNDIDLNVSALAPGVFHVRLRTADGAVAVASMIIAQQ